MLQKTYLYAISAVAAVATWIDEVVVVVAAVQIDWECHRRFVVEQQLVASSAAAVDDDVVGDDCYSFEKDDVVI